VLARALRRRAERRRHGDVTINGNDGHLTAPGQGSIFADVGKLVYIADPSD
jgi:hypothetical protein